MKARQLVYAMLAATFAMPVGVRAQDRSSAIEDNSVVDARYPAVTRPVAITSGDARMNGVLFLAEGVGPHPNAVILHGFPGSTKNEDLAYATRQTGWNVLTFQYRGSWGSEGNFSYSGALADVSAAIAFLGSPAGAGERGLPDQVVLIGHSFGGWAALMTAANHPKVRAVASIAGRNVGRAAAKLGDADFFAARLKSLSDFMLPIRGISAEDLLREQLMHSEEWDLTRQASALSQKAVLLVAGKRDTAAPLAEDHHPLLEALRQERAPKMTSIIVDADHAFSDKRPALAAALVSWLADVAPP